jgi:hypothetical protein
MMSEFDRVMLFAAVFVVICGFLCAIKYAAGVLSLKGDMDDWREGSDNIEQPRHYDWGPIGCGKTYAAADYHEFAACFGEVEVPNPEYYDDSVYPQFSKIVHATDPDESLSDYEYWKAELVAVDFSIEWWENDSDFLDGEAEFQLHKWHEYRDHAISELKECA